MCEQRTLNLGDRKIYCYADGSIEFAYRGSTRRTFGFPNKYGYKQIRLSICGKKTTLLIHRLIASAFHSKLDVFDEVDHINRNRSDNRPENLRWCNSKTNNNNRIDIDRSIEKYGVRRCDNQKSYYKEYKKEYYASRFALHAVSPEGKNQTYYFRSSECEEYKTLKNLSQRDRYFKYHELNKT